MTDDQLRGMVEEIDDRGEGLTDWECQFIARLIDDDVSTFTPRQAEQIERIYKEKMP